MKRIIIALLVMIGLVSCNGGRSFKINVNLDNSTGKTILLQRYVGDEMQTLKTMVAKNNEVVFKVKKSDNTDALHLMIDGWRRPVVIFAENKDVTVTGDCQKPSSIKATGSEIQMNLDKFQEEISKIDDEKECRRAVIDYFKTNIDNPSGIYVAYRYKWALNDEDLINIEDNIPAELNSGYKYVLKNYLKKISEVGVGKNYVNISQKDINGNMIQLADVVSASKVVIVDFWASWCPDCRKVNPDLVKVYNKYKDKGVEIFSVSLDTDTEAWKKGIADDNLCWPYHVSDLQGWKNKAADDYCIAFIPQNVFIGNNGKILYKNVPMDKMEACLEDILNRK